jgi:hypothetical protein
MDPKPDGYAVRITLKMTNPAFLSEGGVGDYQKSCGGGISALKQTVLLAVSADVSVVRGMSVAEGFVRVGEPRLVVES